MSKFHVGDGVEYHTSYFVREDEFQHLEGNLLTYIEMLGLPEKQEEALKSKVRQSIWGGTALKGRTVLPEDVPDVVKLIQDKWSIRQKEKESKN